MSDIWVIILIIVVVVLSMFDFGKAVPVSVEYMRGVVGRSPFFDRMTVQDLKARGATSIEDSRARYLAACLPLTPGELAELSMLLGEMPLMVEWSPDGISTTNTPKIRVRLSRVQKFVKLAEGTENNWPHTLGDVVCLPSNFFGRPDMFRVLIHECVHVWQRQHADVLGRYLAGVGMTPMAMPEARVNNPDIDGYAYVYRGNMSMLSYLTPTSGMADAIVVAYLGTRLDNHPWEQMAGDIGDYYSGTKII